MPPQAETASCTIPSPLARSRPTCTGRQQKAARSMPSGLPGSQLLRNENGLGPGAMMMIRVLNADEPEHGVPKAEHAERCTLATPKDQTDRAHLHPVRAASPSLRQSRRAAATWFLLRTPENPANATHDSRNPENQDNRQSVYGQRANGECQCVLANHEVARKPSTATAVSARSTGPTG
jgi:hypothetical protein